MASTGPVRAAEKLASKQPPTWEGFVAFLKGVRDELKKAHWPSRAELIRLTQVVLLAIGVVAIYCGALDALLGLITSKLLPHR